MESLWVGERWSIKKIEFKNLLTLSLKLSIRVCFAVRILTGTYRNLISRTIQVYHSWKLLTRGWKYLCPGKNVKKISRLSFQENHSVFPCSVNAYLVLYSRVLYCMYCRSCKKVFWFIRYVAYWSEANRDFSTKTIQNFCKHCTGTTLFWEICFYKKYLAYGQF